MDLETKIRARDVSVGILGLGYVGLPLCRAFWEAEVRVVGFDVDPEKVERLGRGENYLRHLGEDLVAPMLASGRFEATSDMGRLGEPDVVIICVPTPLSEHLQPDLRYVEGSADAIGRVVRAGQLVVLESTTYPGTTREVVLPPLQSGGLELGRDVYVAYSPEREDPGRKDHTTRTTPKLVGGLDARSGELAELLYGLAIARVVRVSSAEVAEAAKLLENVYRAVNIALVNEMKVVLDAMGVDVWEVIEAASTKPFGFQPFYPGPGLGGHCIPIDPYYLVHKARELGHGSRFIELAGEVNRAMPDYVIQRTAWALNERAKPVKGSRVLVLGLAYKPNVDDCRESPSFALIDRLRALGAEVAYNDPHVPEAPRVRRYDLRMRSVELTPETIRSFDCVLVATDHDAVDWQALVDHAHLIIDTRNAVGRRLRTRPANVVAA
ncbi:MAG: nucleotide sugar dehydrogenase [Myxococcota bacterium]